MEINDIVFRFGNLANCANKTLNLANCLIEVIEFGVKNGNLKIADFLPKKAELASALGVSVGLVQNAYKIVEDLGYIESKQCVGTIIRDWRNGKNKLRKSMKSEDLQNEIKDYISSNLKVGDKMPTNRDLSVKLNVSIRTIHNNIKKLVDEGILQTKRGRYGTLVMRMPNSQAQTKEMSIFAPASEAVTYHYQKIEAQIKKIMCEQFEIGDKLPSISKMSKMLDVSENTIRKAYENLFNDGYIHFERGRYGGTFIIDMPDVESTQSYKWLAVSSTYSQTKV